MPSYDESGLSCRSLSRREVLQVGGTAVLAGSVGSLLSTSTASAQPAAKAPAFRFVFMPDMHYMRERKSPEGIRAALKAVAGLDPKPSFIVTGGDQMDGLRDKIPDEANKLADEFLAILKEGMDLPIYHTLGNHDAVGWNLEDLPKDHPDIGFGLMQRKFGLKKPFYSFDRGGWHFVVLLNMTLTKPGDYVAEFDEEQLRFLREDLEQAKGRPTFVFGHFPPVSAVEFLDGRAKVEEKDWRLSTQRMTRNPFAFVSAARHANVKAFFSGHIHRTDQIEVMGQRFICAGSVSGNKWRGHDHDTPEGFGVIDCRADGTFDYRYHDYGWEAPTAE